MLSYEEVFIVFLSKVTEYHFCNFTDDENNGKSINLLHGACVGFYTCKYDLYDRDDEKKCFNFDISDKEKYEIIDILSDGMMLQWLMPYVYKNENLENILTTSEYQIYSPSQFLKEIYTIFTSTKNTFEQRVKDYSYSHADLTGLST